MANYNIRRSHANKVLAILREAGFDPSQFRWEDRPSRDLWRGTVSTLVHVATGHFMKFDQSNNGHHLDFSPAGDRARDQEYPGTWESAVEHIRKWAVALKVEVEAPDLWKAVAGERELIADVGPEDRDDAPKFTVEERTRIAASLTEIREYLGSIHHLNSEQVRIVDSRLSYLERASVRLGRKDWTVLALGVLTNIVLSAGLSPELAREMFRFAGQVLGWIVRQPALPP